MSAQACPDCNGLGKYVGFLNIDECRTCRGSGLMGEACNWLAKRLDWGSKCYVNWTYVLNTVPNSYVPTWNGHMSASRAMFLHLRNWSEVPDDWLVVVFRDRPDCKINNRILRDVEPVTGNIKQWCPSKCGWILCTER